MARRATFSRKTKETDITAEIIFGTTPEIDINSEVPFFNHLLHAMAFHGEFGLKLKAKGDIDVDPHHLIEDTGLVLGEALSRIIEGDSTPGQIRRFGYAVIPMDEALVEVVIDVCGRPTMILKAAFPQERVSDFDTSLIREFLIALANKARFSIHVTVRHGENSHHISEAMFKALGKAINLAYKKHTVVMSTKGIIV
jgi:imidazoleglycerol-phosphate dehydratase